MSVIDPESPRESGYCGCGCKKTVELGDHDCDGYFIGWIDEDGLCWESRRERDCSLVSGRFFDAWRRWNKAGGVLGREPKPEDFLEEVGVHPLWEDEAIRDAYETIDPNDPLFRISMFFASKRACLN